LLLLSNIQVTSPCSGLTIWAGYSSGITNAFDDFLYCLSLVCPCHEEENVYAALSRGGVKVRRGGGGFGNRDRHDQALRLVERRLVGEEEAV